MKKTLLIFGLGLGFLGFSALAVSAWNCAGDFYCQQQGLAGIFPARISKAIDINYSTDTPDGWSGKTKPDLTITDPKRAIYIPPPPPPKESH